MSERSTYGFGRFTSLVGVLGTSTKTGDKLDALKNYFRLADERDKVWVIAIFSGRRPRRTMKVGRLSQWCMELTGIPDWLFLESYATVGDLAETLALLVPDSVAQAEQRSLDDYITSLKALEGKEEAVQKNFITSAWRCMDKEERFVFNKLITGNFRIGVSQQMMVKALASTEGLEPSQIAHRISGNWDPFTIGYKELLGGDLTGADASKPYPFYLAYALDTAPQELGPTGEWQAEWKWDGIRGQVIKREGSLFIWSRGEELVTEKFPELHRLADILPDGTVLDGEILCIASDVHGWKAMPFALLQTRIGRKNVTRKHLQESPVGFIVYDILEHRGSDIREMPLAGRRSLLADSGFGVPGSGLFLSPVLDFSDWNELAEARLGSRDIGSEGLMLKRMNSPYQVGRKRGDWYKWKIDPLTIDAVMIYAQKGSGRRSNLFTDYTFAVRDGERLVSFAKAYSGLTDKEFAEVDAFVKKNAIEKFGPVRTVKPELVFEIAFEGIAASSRHKSGVALRFPRISRWRKDKPVSEINTLDDLKQMLRQYGKP